MLIFIRVMYIKNYLINFEITLFNLGELKTEKLL